MDGKGAVGDTPSRGTACELPYRTTSSSVTKLRFVFVGACVEKNKAFIVFSQGFFPSRLCPVSSGLCGEFQNGERKNWKSARVASQFVLRFL